MRNNHGIRNHVWAFLCLSGLFAMPYANATVAEKVLQAEVSPNLRYWFVNSATQAKIAASPQRDGSFNLVLEGLVPYISYFTERPQRQSGTMTIQQLLRLWEEKGQDSFHQDPPNAALSGIPVNAKTGAVLEGPTFSLALELLNAHYDPNSKTLSYTAKLLKNSTSPIPAAMTLQHVTLFIDGVCLSCWD